MLQHVQVRNLAIVTALEIDLHQGMTTLTGETGAGKSILIEALGLVLGDRADNGMIGSDGDRAEVTALFDVGALPDALAWLRGHSLEQEGECILRRVLVRDGSSRAFVNGSPVTLRSLAELGDLLVEIHGQHAHQALLRREHQRELLDAYGGLQTLCGETRSAHGEWHRASAELKSLRDASRSRTERLDLLRYQVEELSALGLTPDSLSSLEEEHRRQANAERLLANCSTLQQLLDDEEHSVLGLLNRAGRILDGLTALDPALQETREMLEGAGIQVGEALADIRGYADRLEMDPGRLEELEQRLAAIHDLARKQHCRPDELPARLAQLQQELERLEHADVHLEALERRTGEFRSLYLDRAHLLDGKRRLAAEELAGVVTRGMQSLGMAGGALEIPIETLPAEQASPHGLNSVEYRVSTNPGQPGLPLARIVSGGELSRISLALQVATARCRQTPTLVFDEVDVGIGGAVAEIVGRQLRQLGENRQLLCVTHLPQVAAQGHRHLVVRKSSAEKETRSTLTALDEEERVREIARMLGGVRITEQTLAHAREMIVRATE